MPNSYVEYTTGGSSINELQQAVFSYSPIEVISANDIKAFAIKSNGDKHQFTISSRNATAKTVTLSELPSSLSPSVSKVRIYRQTSSDALVDFVDGARLTERDLDTAYKQSLLVGQEVQEDAAGNNTTLNNVTDLTLGGMTTVTNLTATGTVSLPSNTNLSLNNLTTTGTVQIPSGTHANHFYREGTWTPVLSGLDTTGSTINFAEFTKIGRVVHIICHITFVSNSDTSGIAITGLPYSGNNNKIQSLPTPFSNYTSSPLIPIVQDTTIFIGKNNYAADATYQDVSGKYVRISGSYQIL